MMENVGLFGMDSVWDHYTWSNKQVWGTIYYRIDKVLSNIEWFHGHMDFSLTIMPLNVPDHALLYLKSQDQPIIRKSNFKFSNNVVNMEGFQSAVANSWREHIRGRPVYVLWMKPKRLQPIMRSMGKPLVNLIIKVKKARSNLLLAQQTLMTDEQNTWWRKLRKVPMKCLNRMTLRNKMWNIN